MKNRAKSNCIVIVTFTYSIASRIKITILIHITSTIYMYIRIIAIFVLLAYSPLHALEYTHTDGTQVSVAIPNSFNSAIQRTIASEIQKIFPPKNTTKIIEITRLGNDFLNLEDILETAHWEHTVHIKNIYSDDSITSVLLTTYEYTGGAHSSMSRIGLVMDTKTGEKLSLADFYNTNKLVQKLSPVWNNQIGIRLKKIIERDLSKDEKNWINEGTKDIEQYESFTITPRILTIYGQQYQHNAYAYGIQTLIFPKFKLKDIAK